MATRTARNTPRSLDGTPAWHTQNHGGRPVDCARQTAGILRHQPIATSLRATAEYAQSQPAPLAERLRLPVVAR
eukprot:2732507-Lingulodinium_polyedra.AAC.1